MTALGTRGAAGRVFEANGTPSVVLVAHDRLDVFPPQVARMMGRSNAQHHGAEAAQQRVVGARRRRACSGPLTPPRLGRRRSPSGRCREADGCRRDGDFDFPALARPWSLAELAELQPGILRRVMKEGAGAAGPT